MTSRGAPSTSRSWRQFIPRRATFHSRLRRRVARTVSPRGAALVSREGHDTVAAPDEAPIRQLSGIHGRLATALAIGLSLYALYWVLFVVQPQVYRVRFLLVALVLTFLLVPSGFGGGGQGRAPQTGSEATTGRARSTRISALDWILAGAAIAALTWPLVDFERFVYRAADPLPSTSFSAC
jgi:TRAP-type uncharacterized transport system fused permease subunit